MYLRLVFLWLIIFGLTACGGGTPGNNSKFTVLSISPDKNASIFSVKGPIEVHFSKDLPQTLPADSIWLEDPSENHISGTWTVTGSTATFTPSAPLSYNTLYVVKVSRDVASSANDTLPQNFSYTFTTEAVKDTTAPQITATFTTYKVL